MNRNSKKLGFYIILAIFILLIICIVFLGFYIYDIKKVKTDIVSTKASNQTTSEIETKIEEINQVDEAYLISRYGRIKTLFGNCDPKEEYRAITERLNCIRQEPKAEKYWHDIELAESEVKTMLENNDVDSIAQYLSCDAYDLTWYEMHCEADRIRIEPEYVRHLLTRTNRTNPDILKKAIWIRRKPDPRIFRNPRWIIRSRLVNPEFKLVGPWKYEPHPTENGTLLLLEQRLDGRIYIVGIPVTGTEDE